MKNSYYTCTMIRLDSNIQHQLKSKGRLHPTDLKYKQLLREGIQDTFQFSPKIEALDQIVGPMELRMLLRNFTRKDFNTGQRITDKISSPMEFDNIKNGKFRVNLHIHTNKSDGAMTPQEYLEMSKKYADKAAISNPHSNIPPYTANTSDHNNFDAAKEIIASMAEEPKKYKNFKYVPGCEFMFYDKNSPFQYKTFEAIGMSFNPFDKELAEKTSKMNSVELINSIKKDGAIMSYAHPIPQLQGNGMDAEFIKYLKSKGVDSIEANYQYLNFKNTEELRNSIEQSHKIADENNLFKTGGTDSHSHNIFGARAINILDELI